MKNINNLNPSEIIQDEQYLMCIKDEVAYSIMFTAEDMSIEQAFREEETGVDHDTKEMQGRLNNGLAVWVIVTVTATSAYGEEVMHLGGCFDDSLHSLYESEINGYLEGLISDVEPSKERKNSNGYIFDYIDRNMQALTLLQSKTSDGSGISKNVIYSVVNGLANDHSPDGLMRVLNDGLMIAHCMRVDWMNNFIGSLGYADYYGMTATVSRAHVDMIVRESNKFQRGIK